MKQPSPSPFAASDLPSALLRLGLPTMAGMLISSLYPLVDGFWVGRLGALPTAAVSVVYPLNLVGIAVGLLFGSGASSAIARLLGKGQGETAKGYSSTAMVSGLGTMAVLTAGMLAFLSPLLTLLGATAGSLADARAYASLFLPSLLFSVFNLMMNNLFAAEGNTTIGLAAMAVGGCVNLVLDPVAIFLWDLGVRGAALTTLLSQLLSAALYVLYLARGHSQLSLSPRYWTPSPALFQEILKIGLPVCLFQLLTGGVISLTNLLARPFGPEAIAALGIVNRILSLETNALYGFLKGYSPLAGYHYGAGHLDRVKALTNLALRWSTLANVLWGLVCLVFARDLMSLFNQDSPQVLAIGALALRLNGLSYMTFGVQVVIGNYFLAVGKAREGGLLSICRQGLFLIPALLLFSRLWGLPGLLWAQPATDLCATLLTVRFWRRELPALAPSIPRKSS